MNGLEDLCQQIQHAPKDLDEERYGLTPPDTTAKTFPGFFLAKTCRPLLSTLSELSSTEAGSALNTKTHKRQLISALDEPIEARSNLS